MDIKAFNMGEIDIAWCPGCGNFNILIALKQALVELDLPPEQVVIISGIGQAAKLPHYLKANVFHGLHGRSLPVAAAIKAVNPTLTVIAESGDGCMYGEGGNHFIHAVRRNPDIVNIVHNNMVYGLTKGQASPTTERGFKTPVQPRGVSLEPFNPIAIAISLDASFVARAFAADIEKTKEIIKMAITHKGYALVDIFQPCVSFNKINTYQWFKERCYYLEQDYEPLDRIEAFKRATEKEKLPLGVFYINTAKSTFNETLNLYHDNDKPLFKRELDREKINGLINSKKIF
jgi:2-oxoglutarate ferredoxin oxidoreductase subunit beta